MVKKTITEIDRFDREMIMKLYFEAISNSTLSSLVNNDFWDNSDPEGKKSGVLLPTDKRKEFVIAFEEWAQPYCIEGTEFEAIPNGLFGAGQGMLLYIRSGAIKKSVGLSLEALVKKFGDNNNIPVYTKVEGRDLLVFSNIYSLDDYTYSFSSNIYSKKSERNRAIASYKKVYGRDPSWE